MNKALYIFIVCICFCLCSTAQAPRIPNSPYPVSIQPDTLFMVDIDLFPATQQLSVVTLQGLLAKTKPRIMTTRGAAVLRSNLAANYGVMYDSTYFNDFAGLLNYFKPDVSGYILCNIHDSTTNAGISICTFYNAITACPSDTALFDSLGIPMLNNVIGKNEGWAYDTFQPYYSKRIISYQDVSKSTYLADWTVFAHAFQMYDLIPLTDLANNAFSNLAINSAAFGWAEEHTFVYEASTHGSHVHASDFCSNLTTFSNFTAPVQQKNRSTDTLLKPGVHTVCFLMSDGDNVQWLMGDFADGHNWYGSSKRGTCNMGWTVSPALAELSPTELKYLYDSAASTPTGKDYFVAGPSGMGYIYPDNFVTLDSAADISARMMKKADMSIVNIIGNVWGESFFEPYLNEPDIDAIFFYDYNDFYFGEHGITTCINGKPVISARYDLVTAYFTVDTLAQLLNSQLKDPAVPEGYSLVAVNAWTDGMDSLIACYQKLDSTVRVVTPDAFVKLFKAGTGCTVTAVNTVEVKGAMQLKCAPNPGSVLSKVSYNLPQPAEVELYVSDVYGRRVKALFSGSESMGNHQLLMDVSTLSEGMYYVTLWGKNFQETVKYMVAR